MKPTEVQVVKKEPSPSKKVEYSESEESEEIDDYDDEYDDEETSATPVKSMP